MVTMFLIRYIGSRYAIMVNGKPLKGSLRPVDSKQNQRGVCPSREERQFSAPSALTLGDVFLVCFYLFLRRKDPLHSQERNT